MAMLDEELDLELDRRLGDLLTGVAEVTSPPSPAAVCRRGRRRVVRLAVAAAALALLAPVGTLVAGGVLHPEPAATRPVTSPTTLPPNPSPVGARLTFAGHLLDGRPWSSLSARGRLLVVNVTASWCDPCLEEQRALTSTASAYQPRGVRFVAVDIYDVRADAMAMVHSRTDPIRYPVLFDQGPPPARLARRLGVRGIPLILILNRDGVVVDRLEGAVAPSRLATLLDLLLAHPDQRSGSGQLPPPRS
jgi:thiol-disulfide isomerase/thioredoxin